MSDNSECPDGTGPYIPISECITGVRAQDEQRHFTFEERNIINTRGHQYTSHPQIRVNSELSENDSNLSEDDDGSLHASHQNLHWSVTKTFTKLSISPKKNGPEEGPPVPPRPPKTFAGRSRDTLTKDPFQGPKIQEPTEVVLEPLQHSHQRLRVPRRMSQGAPSSPRSLLNARCPEEEEDFAPAQSSLQYCNLPTLPPAVDRALKPRHSTHSIGHSNAFVAQEDGLHNEVHRYETVKPYRPSIRRTGFLSALRNIFVAVIQFCSFRSKASKLSRLRKQLARAENARLACGMPPSRAKTLEDKRRPIKRGIILGIPSSRVDTLEIPSDNLLEIKIPSRKVGIITIPPNLLPNIVVMPQETVNNLPLMISQ